MDATALLLASTLPVRDAAGMLLFLSHAGPDKPIVRRLGAHLAAVGGEVFFDEWSIAAGESIPGAIDDALRNHNVFVLV